MDCLRIAIRLLTRAARREGKFSEWQGERVNRRFAIVLVIVVCFGAGVLAYVFRMRLAASAEFEHQVKLSQEEAASIRAQVIVPTEKRVLARDNFTAALEKFGLSHQDAANASSAAQHAFNLKQVRAGNSDAPGANLWLRPGFLHGPAQRRHIPRVAREKEVRQRKDGGLRKDLCRRVRQWRQKIPGAPFS